MKIRFGFVSNSSSSSFIIGCKEKPSREMLMEALGVKENSVLYEFAGEIADIIIRRIDDITDEDIENNYRGKLLEKCREIKNKGMRIFQGRADSDTDSYAEMGFYGMTVNYNSGDIIIFKQND